jgi:hypothetical protein
VETCQAFEEWYANTDVSEYINDVTLDELDKALAWAAWEAGSASLGECLKSMKEFIDKEIEEKYGVKPTMEERDWMFAQLKAKRASEANNDILR